MLLCPLAFNLIYPVCCPSMIFPKFKSLTRFFFSPLLKTHRWFPSPFGICSYLLSSLHRVHLLCLFSTSAATAYSVKLLERLKVESEIAQSCPTLCDPMYYSLPGSSVHGIFQARILEGVAINSLQFPKCITFPRLLCSWSMLPPVSHPPSQHIHLAFNLF